MVAFLESYGNYPLWLWIVSIVVFNILQFCKRFFISHPYSHLFCSYLGDYSYFHDNTIHLIAQPFLLIPGFQIILVVWEIWSYIKAYLYADLKLVKNNKHLLHTFKKW